MFLYGKFVPIYGVKVCDMICVNSTIYGTYYYQYYLRLTCHRVLLGTKVRLIPQGGGVASVPLHEVFRLKVIFLARVALTYMGFIP